jgi:hypothetical protein
MIADMGLGICWRRLGHDMTMRWLGTVCMDMGRLESCIYSRLPNTISLLLYIGLHWLIV